MATFTLELNSLYSNVS